MLVTLGLRDVVIGEELGEETGKETLKLLELPAPEDGPTDDEVATIEELETDPDDPIKFEVELPPAAAPPTQTTAGFGK